MLKKINFSKLNGLVPAVIQDSVSGKVLMTGFMNAEALMQTQKTGKVTFYSRTQKKLWIKGETSGNYLITEKILEDCDRDTLLIYARPVGAVCHTGQPTCFEHDTGPQLAFLQTLQQLVHERKEHAPQTSYTAQLFNKGLARIAQKVGEEAVECVIETMKGDRKRLKEEAADLLYHLLVLLSAQDLEIADIVTVLKNRHK